jgi:stage III sporulation protein SpoIIIAA
LLLIGTYDIVPSIDDLFWEEKIKRTIQECNSSSTLKEIATLLARIATQRQGVIRGLVKDIHVFNNVLIDKNELANPDIKN